MPRKLTQEKFINRSIQVHGDKFDYSKMKYVNSNTKVRVICKKHGAFRQWPIDHLRGRGCSKCGKESVANKLRKSKELFVEQASKIHGNKYDYSLVEYKGTTKKKVKIICPTHGVFNQFPNDHLRGHGCVGCGFDIGFNKFRKDKIDNFKTNVLIRCSLIHHNKFCYDLVSDIKNGSDKVKILCNKHGVFLQSLSIHVYGSGCPKCSRTTSKSETFTKDFLVKRNITFVEQKTFKDLVSPKSGRKLKYDFFLPNQNLIIELDGMQHFKSIRFQGCSKEEAERIFVRTKLHDNIKNNYATTHNINLVRIPYTKFTDLENILLKILKFKS